MGTRAGGRWVGTRPFQGSCQNIGPAWLGLFKSCGHTPQGGQGCPLSMPSSFTPAQPPVPQKALSPLPFLPAPPLGWLFRAPCRPDTHSPSSPTCFLGQPSAGLSLCSSLPGPSWPLSPCPSTHSQHLGRQGSANVGLTEPLKEFRKLQTMHKHF